MSHERYAEVIAAAAEEAGLPAEARLAHGTVPGLQRRRGGARRPARHAPRGPHAPAPPCTTRRAPPASPKGVKRPLHDVDPDVMAELFTGFFNLFGIPHREDQVHLCTSPNYHTAVTTFAGNSLNSGHRVVFMDKWDPERDARQDRALPRHPHPHGPDAVPPDAAAARRREGRSTTCRRCGGRSTPPRPCPIDVKQKMLDWWGPVIWEYYGATEGGGTTATPEDWLKYPGTVGSPWPISELKITDDDRNPVEPRGARHRLDEDGRPGLRVQGRQVQDRREPRRRGLLHRRRRRLPQRGRLPVPLRPQERHDHRRRREHLPGRDRGRDPRPPRRRRRRRVRHPRRRHGRADQGRRRARRRATRPATSWPRRSWSTSSGRLAKFKWPRSIDFSDELPREPTGKLLKRQLRDPYWEGRTTAI